MAAIRIIGDGSPLMDNSLVDNCNLVTTDELRAVIEMQLDALWADPTKAKTLPPIFVHSSPGLGKSSIVRQICESRGIDLIDVRLAQMEAVDIRGLPVPNKEDKSVDWLVNSSWPRDPNGKGIIFLDEMSSCDKSVQVAAYELVLDRRLGKLYSVPPGYLIVAAGNTTTDNAVVSTMSSALANRFLHLELRHDSPAWLKWARGNNIHPSVVGFITFKPEMLFKMDDNENLERGWPSPRSWERVSEMCHICKDENILRKLVYGLIGSTAGAQFMVFYKLNLEFVDMLKIMTDPSLPITIPKQADRTYAMVSAMLYLLWRGTTPEDEAARIDGFFRVCMKLDSSYSSMAVTAAMQGANKEADIIRAKKLVACPLFKEWKKKNSSTLNNLESSF